MSHEFNKFADKHPQSQGFHGPCMPFLTPRHSCFVTEQKQQQVAQKSWRRQSSQMDSVSAPRLAAGNTDPKLALRLKQKGNAFCFSYVLCQNGRNIHSPADEPTSTRPTFLVVIRSLSRIALRMVCSLIHQPNHLS